MKGVEKCNYINTPLHIQFELSFLSEEGWIRLKTLKKRLKKFNLLRTQKKQAHLKDLVSQFSKKKTEQKRIQFELVFDLIWVKISRY
jgi:pyruvate/oxaloacetate carboxyltransferase